jgi:hypothetical protein
VLFIFFISVVLVNLLVGLTISKTEELYREAGIFRLEKTVLQVHRRIVAGRLLFANIADNICKEN